MLLVKVIKEPFYHSCPLGFLAIGYILLTYPIKAEINQIDE
jgi:hypothetical protein